MEEKNDIFGMLELLLRPCFCVKENRIVQLNTAGKRLLLTPGIDVRDLLVTGKKEYSAFSGGCLFLEMSVQSQIWGACVTRIQEYDVFVLESAEDNPQLQVLALASRELRDALSSAMIASEHLLPDETDPLAVARLNRSLMRTLRVVGNMSDAGTPFSPDHLELRDAAKIFQEIWDKAAAVVGQNRIQMLFDNLQEEIFCPIDQTALERAVLNMLSNALKFTPAGGTVHASLTRRGTLLMFSVEDNGSGIGQQLWGNVFTRYLRAPALEDRRQGLGLGMLIIRSVAALHGGTVLLDQPNKAGVRVTLTLSIRRSGQHSLRSPILCPDYAGDWDHCLLELSDCLPLEAFF